MTSDIKIQAETLSPLVLRDLRENYSLKEIEQMTVSEAFDAWLQYNGIIGFGTRIRRVLFDISTSSTGVLYNTDGKIEEIVREHYFDLGSGDIL